jgi:hypothetical protein
MESVDQFLGIREGIEVPDEPMISREVAAKFFLHKFLTCSRPKFHIGKRPNLTLASDKGRYFV